MTSYIGIAIYLVNIISYKVYAKTKKVELATMDLVTNRLEDDGSKYPSTLEKMASWVVRRCRD
jgi:amino acid transporter